MNLEKEIRPITYLKNRAAELLKQVNETRRPVIITQNGEARGVLLDPKSYESMRNALGMMRLLAEGEVDIRAGRYSGQDEVFARVRKASEES